MGVLELQIPRDSYGRIIGRAGSTLKQLRDEHGVSIDIPREGTCVVLTGPDDGIASCKRAIEGLVGFAVGSDPIVKAELAVDPGQYGALIGPGGSTLRELERTSGASVAIPPRGQSGPVVVQGPNHAVQAAVQQIGALVGHVQVLAQSTAAVSAPEREHVNLAARKPINEALFFPERAAEGTPNFDRFVAYLESVKHTLDVCVFTISDNTIAAAIIHAHASGAKVRVITDDECSANQGSDIARMRDAGIPVVMDNSPAHMHHKFAILDGTVLINGSFNWTRGAATTNCENIMIVNAAELVQSYQREFNRLWAAFS